MIASVVLNSESVSSFLLFKRLVSFQLCIIFRKKKQCKFGTNFGDYYIYTNILKEFLCSRLEKKGRLQCTIQRMSGKLAEFGSRPRRKEILSWRGSNKGGVSNHLANHASQPPAHPATQTSRCSSVYQTWRNKVPAWFLRACTGVANST